MRDYPDTVTYDEEFRGAGGAIPDGETVTTDEDVVNADDKDVNNEDVYPQFNVGNGTQSSAILVFVYQYLPSATIIALNIVVPIFFK